MRMTNHVRIPAAGVRRFVALTLALAGLSAACQSKPAAPPVSDERVGRGERSRDHPRRRGQGLPASRPERPAAGRGGRVRGQARPARRPDRPGGVPGEGARAQDRRPGVRARHGVRRGAQEHPGGGVPAGTREAVPDGRRHARGAASRDAGAEALRARGVVEGLRDRPGDRGVLRGEQVAVQPNRGRVPRRADRRDARERGAGDQPHGQRRDDVRWRR